MIHAIAEEALLRIWHAVCANNEQFALQNYDLSQHAEDKYIRLFGLTA